ncbi:MAG: flagellar hook-basal body protein [Candidatus Riflebacteria bacterium]|nr:flagellar hook-basal body protein [Candidatus Riflebacteria bacterium]
MIRGLYTSASGMLVETIRQDMLANNLANVDTTGFKADGGIFKELPTMEIRRVNDGKLYPPRPFYKYPIIGQLGTGATFDEGYTDFSAGKMSFTGNNLDVALENPQAFFVVQSPEGVRFSRDGVFKVNENGFLVNLHGDYILGETGERPEILLLDGEEDNALIPGLAPIRIPADTKAYIDESGRVLANGEAVGNIALGSAADRKAFRKEGANKFKRAYGDVARAESNFLPGYIEKPNFSIVSAMVKMIEVSRAYEANAKVVQAHETMIDKAVNSVGVSRR